jgi:hypothetical protein
MEHGFFFQILAYVCVEFAQRLNLTLCLSRFSFFLDLDMMVLTSSISFVVKCAKPTCIV